MSKEYAITTKDNPFSPFDQFKEWFLFDELHGYHSCSLLARVSRTSDQFTDIEYNNEISRAIDEIIKFDLQKIYVKVEREADKIEPFVVE